MWYKRKLGAYMTPPLSDIGQEFGCEGYVIYEFAIQVIGTTFQNNLLRFDENSLTPNLVFLSILEAFTKVSNDKIFKIILRLIEYGLLELTEENILFSTEISDSFGEKLPLKTKSKSKSEAGRIGGIKSAEARKLKKQSSNDNDYSNQECHENIYHQDNKSFENSKENQNENQFQTPKKTKYEVTKKDLLGEGESFDVFDPRNPKRVPLFDIDAHEMEIQRQYDLENPFPFQKQKAFPTRDDLQDMFIELISKYFDFVPAWYSPHMVNSPQERKAWCYIINLSEDKLLDKLWLKDQIYDVIENMCIKLVKKKSNHAFCVSNLYNAIIAELKAWYLDCKDDPVQDQSLKDLAVRYLPLSEMPKLPPYFAN